MDNNWFHYIRQKRTIMLFSQYNDAKLHSTCKNSKASAPGFRYQRFRKQSFLEFEWMNDCFWDVLPDDRISLTAALKFDPERVSHRVFDNIRHKIDPVPNRKSKSPKVVLHKIAPVSCIDTVVLVICHRTARNSICWKRSQLLFPYLPFKRRRKSAEIKAAALWNDLCNSVRTRMAFSFA